GPLVATTAALFAKTVVPCMSLQGPTSASRSMAFTVELESQALNVPFRPAPRAADWHFESAPVRPPRFPPKRSCVMKTRCSAGRRRTMAVRHVVDSALNAVETHDMKALTAAFSLPAVQC